MLKELQPGVRCAFGNVFLKPLTVWLVLGVYFELVQRAGSQISCQQCSFLQLYRKEQSAAQAGDCSKLKHKSIGILEFLTYDIPNVTIVLRIWRHIQNLESGENWKKSYKYHMEEGQILFYNFFQFCLPVFLLNWEVPMVQKNRIWYCSEKLKQ